MIASLFAIAFCIFRRHGRCIVCHVVPAICSAYTVIASYNFFLGEGFVSPMMQRSVSQEGLYGSTASCTQAGISIRTKRKAECGAFIEKRGARAPVALALTRLTCTSLSFSFFAWVLASQASPGLLRQSLACWFVLSVLFRLPFRSRPLLFLLLCPTCSSVVFFQRFCHLAHRV